MQKARQLEGSRRASVLPRVSRLTGNSATKSNSAQRKCSSGTFANLADSNWMIAEPKISREHPDRSLLAEEAIEPAFDTIASEAERRGWSRDEAAFALLNLAVARICAIDADQETDEAVARSIQSVHGAAG
jgi:hypothetical protein